MSLLLLDKKIDPHAKAFFSAGSISAADQKAAINKLILSLKNNALWNKFYALYPFVGGNATSHSLNLINTSLYQITWVAAPSHSLSGVDFNGTTQYGKTGLIPSSVMTLNNTALHYYSRDNIAESGIEMGAQNIAATERISLVLRFTGDLASSTQYNITAGQGQLTISSRTDSRGFQTASRIDSTTHVVYFNGSNIGSNATGGGALPSFEIYIGAININGAAGTFSTKQCALSAISLGLNTAEASLFYTIVQELQTDLNRQV